MATHASLRTWLVVLFTILMFSTVGASWTAVWMLHVASEARAEQADRADDRAERLVELLEEGRDEWSPALQRIEDRLEELD